MQSQTLQQIKIEVRISATLILWISILGNGTTHLFCGGGEGQGLIEQSLGQEAPEQQQQGSASPMLGDYWATT